MTVKANAKTEGDSEQSMRFMQAVVHKGVRGQVDFQTNHLPESSYDACRLRMPNLISFLLKQVIVPEWV